MEQIAWPPIDNAIEEIQNMRKIITNQAGIILEMSDRYRAISFIVIEISDNLISLTRSVHGLSDEISEVTTIPNKI